MTKIQKEILPSEVSLNPTSADKISKEFSGREYTRIDKSCKKQSHFIKLMTRVGLTATVVLLCFIPLCFEGFRNKIRKSRKAEIKDLEITRTWAKQDIESRIQVANKFLKTPFALYVSDNFARLLSGEELNPHRNDIVIPKKIKIFVKIKTEMNEIRKVFSKDSLDELTTAEFLEEIKGSLNNEIDNSQHNAQKISFVTIFQDDKDELYSELQHSSIHLKWGSGKYNKTDKVITLCQNYLINKLRFSPEEIFADGKLSIF